MLYRYKKDCEKACINERNSTNNGTIENNNVVEKSASPLGSKIPSNGIGSEKQVSTTSKPSSVSTSTVPPQRTSFTAQKNKNKSHKLLTGK